MHDDHIRGLLRSLEDDPEPDPAYADALFGRLSVVARDERRRHVPVLLLAAALLVALAASIAVGSGLVRLPLVVDDDASPQPSSSALAVTSPSPAASLPSSPEPTEEPSVAPDPSLLAGRTLFAEADGLRVRSEASSDADVVGTLRRGQLMGATGNQLSAEGMEWYEIRIGPGDLHGWIAAGPDKDWLRLVDDGAIAFTCDGCGQRSTVVTINPFGDAAMNVIADDLVDYRWSPDGSRLAVTLSDAQGGSVAVAGSDGTNVRTIGPGGYGPAWSPDGSRLAWSSGSGLVITDAELVPRELELDVRSPGVPYWSPDGSRLAFSAIDCPECPPDEPIFGDPPIAIQTVGTDGSDLRQLIGGAYWGLVGWAGDGSRLAGIETDLSGESPIRAFTVAADGGEPVYLLDGAGISGGPAWSPDGTRIAVPTTDGLVVLDGDGRNPRVVAADSETGIWEVHWSPSGRYLAYTTGGSSAGTGLDLWVVPADGSDAAERVTAEPASAQNAQWQPLLVPLP